MALSHTHNPCLSGGWACWVFCRESWETDLRVCVWGGNPEGSWDHCAQSPFSWKGEEGKGPRTTISALSKLFLKPIAGLSFTQ